ncbi:Cholinesterase [Grifola frondosa]|uniref:Cholinesterase n=1 Tax=Grifola frondosa TaxID=5627 RepID=A0A1C7LTL2_GRIFR|nr:Cholinesterase [Grifola frondosa]
MATFSLIFAALSCFLAVYIAPCASIPTPSSIGSEVTLLYNNDLDLNTAPTHKSVLLLSEKSQSDAVKSCTELGETLLPVNNTFFTIDLAPLVQYQIFQGAYGESQEYWVESSGHVCQVVDAHGTSAPFGASPQPQTSISVSSSDLAITGFRDQLSFKFLGIPYADPPTRFEYPAAYTGPRSINATEFGSQCVQTGAPSSSENCLFLNIWTPFLPQDPTSVSKEQLKAVMFWIHGGAFTSGSGSDPTFDGGNMASRGDVVVVTINYRLSTLGFLALDDGVTNGNFGLADQICSARSAGAASVRALLGSPKAIGKYAAAVPMSNLAGANYATTYSLYYTIPEEVSVAAAPILEATGCSDTDALECLRAVDAQTLVNLASVARFIVVDGTYITSPQLPLNGSGPVANVHTMMGFMRDDGAAFIGYPTSSNLTAGVLGAFLPTSIVNNSLFPEPTGSNSTLDVFNVTARATTDVEFRCLDQATAYSAVNHNLLKSVWFYEFNRSYQTPGFDPNFPVCEAPIDPSHPLGDPSQEYFKCHSGELYYVFGNLPADRPYRDDQDLPFMQQMTDVWTSFARTYDPNPDPQYLIARGYLNVAQHLAGESKWLSVTASTIHTTPVRQLQWESFMTTFGEQEQCEFLGFPLTYYG